MNQENKSGAGNTVEPTAAHSDRVWSEYQHAIFQDIASGKGHTVVCARAGSGKTTTIMQGMTFVPRGCSVLMVAFNKSIAVELQRRAPQGVEVKTLHSLGLKTVCRKYGKVKIENGRADNLVRVLVGGASEVTDLRKAICRAVSLAKGSLAATAAEVDALIDAFGIDTDQIGADGGKVDRDRFIADTLQVLTWCKDPYVQAQMKSARERDSKWSLYRSVEASIDFDDMIWLPVVNDLPVWQFDRVFIDELQDLNACQIELALKACRKNGRICGVGDDCQAIYRFRGADSNAMLNVIQRLSAKVLSLTVTYRCAIEIVKVAQAIVPDLKAAPDAKPGSVAVVGEKEMLREVCEGDFILSRTNAPLIGFCMHLIREGKRANIQGRDIGVQLSSFVKKSKCKSIDAFRNYTDSWRAKEIARLLKKDPPADTQMIEDKAETLLVLAEQCKTVDELLSRIESLFSDEESDKKIILSTTHKAKGLERERCFVLADTYMRKGRNGEAASQEESNLFYVAVTRAKSALFLVRKAT